jgi:hypothetical protein
MFNADGGATFGKCSRFLCSEEIFVVVDIRATAIKFKNSAGEVFQRAWPGLVGDCHGSR